MNELITSLLNPWVFVYLAIVVMVQVATTGRRRDMGGGAGIYLV